MVHPEGPREPGPLTQDDFAAWAAREGAARVLREFLLLPVSVAAAKILHDRMSLHWRSELAADLEAGPESAEGSG
ncbi:hypothetical protein [Streptomyces sp. NPDC005209]|uniref:hypothetical protein n=1 Tax=Streptomyces sp. NPDC005209 TaxID=3156715 RepID=UPI0033BD8269